VIILCWYDSVAKLVSFLRLAQHSRRLETNRPQHNISRLLYNKRAGLYIYIFFLMTIILFPGASSTIFNNDNNTHRPAINKSLGCLNINSSEYWPPLIRCVNIALYRFNYFPRAFAATVAVVAAAAVLASRVAFEFGPYEINNDNNNMCWFKINRRRRRENWNRHERFTYTYIIHNNTYDNIVLQQ